MREMKDSGVPWIGEIPENWGVCRVKHAFTRKNEKAHQDNPIVLSLARSGVRIRDLSNNEGQITESYFDYNPVAAGDLLLNPMDLYSGANCSISRVEGVISPAYVNLRYKEGVADSRYYDYYFKTQYWAMAMFAHGKGVSFDNRWTLGIDTLFNYFIPAPSLQEQRRIADYLDTKCVEIDTIIERTKASIEDYKKLKQSVITEAVTKGIRGDRPMKKTDSVWFAVIPSTWGFKRLKYLFRIEKRIAGEAGHTVLAITQKGVIPKKMDYGNGGQFAEDYSNYQLVYPGDFAMNHMDLLTGWVDISRFAGVTSPDYRVFTLLDQTANHAAYYLYFMQMCYMDKIFYGMGAGVSGMGRWRLQADKFLNLFIPVPPYEEQLEIAAYLDEKCTSIDSLISSKEALITELEVYKKSIIYEYVTGKKEVL